MGAVRKSRAATYREGKRTTGSVIPGCFAREEKSASGAEGGSLLEHELELELEPGFGGVSRGFKFMFK
jgi:hypothetical protein